VWADWIRLVWWSKVVQSYSIVFISASNQFGFKFKSNPVQSN